MKVEIRDWRFLSSEMASLEVDPLCGFSFICPQELPVPDAESIVEELDNQAEFALKRTLAREAHPANALWAASKKHPQLSPIKAENMDLYWNIHCVPGTKGFELLPGLKMKEYDFIAYKGIEVDMHPYGACYHDLANTLSTGVIEYYIANGIRVIIVGGLATSWCVKTTVLQLCRTKKFKVFLNLAACRDIPGSDTEKSIREMEAAGAVIIQSSAEIKMV